MKSFIKILVLLAFVQTLCFSQYSLIQQIANEVSLDSLRLYLRQLSGDTSSIIGGSAYTITSRYKTQTGNQKAAQYIFEKFSSFGLTATYENFSSTGSNVIGTKTGTVYPNRYYIISSHYDDLPASSNAPGADDNGSGTAAVIECARILSKYNLYYTLKFITFDEEEQGLVGSNYYATQARNRGDSILGVINLDMIGYESNNDKMITVYTSNVANTNQIAKDFIDNITLYNIDLVPLLINMQANSDQQSFINKNYGAILVIEDDEFDFNPYYHTSNDRFQYINQNYFYQIAKSAIISIAKYALNLKIQFTHNPIPSKSIISNDTASVFIQSNSGIGVGISQPRLYYRINSGQGFGDFNFLVDDDGPIGQLYQFIIPAQPLGTIVEYYIAVQDPDGKITETYPKGGSGINPPGTTVPTKFFRYYIGEQSVIFSDNFSNNSHWISNSLWGLTNSSYTSSPYSMTDSPGGNYPDNTTNILTLKDTLNIPDQLGALLRFSAKWNLEIDYDYVQVMASTNYGASWIPLSGKYTINGYGTFQPVNQPVYNGVQNSWINEEIDISHLQNKKLQLRFYFKSDGSSTADGFYLDDLKIISFSKRQEQYTATINVNAGWNLISLPIAVNDNRKTTLFPNAISNAFKYDNGYIQSDSIFNGVGYWIKFSSPQSYNLSGLLLDSMIVNIKSGWNLIGGINNNLNIYNLRTIPDSILNSNFYGYENGYIPVNVLLPGKAYWIKAKQDGQIIMK